MGYCVWKDVGIMRAGLRPGAERVPGMPGHGRPHVYFATYLPEDPRLVTGKREDYCHGIAIVYDLV